MLYISQRTIVFSVRVREISTPQSKFIILLLENLP